MAIFGLFWPKMKKIKMDSERKWKVRLYFYAKMHRDQDIRLFIFCLSYPFGGIFTHLRMTKIRPKQNFPFIPSHILHFISGEFDIKCLNQHLSDPNSQLPADHFHMLFFLMHHEIFFWGKTFLTMIATKVFWIDIREVASLVMIINQVIL